MTEDILCCAGARLNGYMLSGRGANGTAWHMDLRTVTRATYCEWRGATSVRYVLRLTSASAVRKVQVDVPRRRMAESRDAIEHRALSARIAEVLAEVIPGFRISYEVQLLNHRFLMAMGSSVILIAAAMLWGGFLAGVGPQSLVIVVILIAASLGFGCLLILRNRGRRRWPNISAAALPGILTAVSRRS